MIAPASPDPHTDLDGALAFVLAAASAPDEPTIYEMTDALLQREIPAERFSVHWVDQLSRRVMLIHARGASIGLPLRHESLPTDHRSLTDAIVRDGQVVVHTVPDDHEIFRGDVLWRRFGMRHIVAAPVPIGGVTAGVIKLYRTTDTPFTERDAAQMRTMGQLLGLVLANRHAQLTPGLGLDQLADAATQLAQAPTREALHAALLRLAVTLTSATVWQLEERDELRFVAAQHADPYLQRHRSLAEVGAHLARQLQAALSDEDPLDASVLVVDPARAGASRLPVWDGMPLELSLAAKAVVISRIGPRDLLVAAWPDRLDTETATQHAETIARLAAIAATQAPRIDTIAALEEQVAELDIARRLVDTVARTPNLREALEVICRTSMLATQMDVVAIGELVHDHLIWHAAAGARNLEFVGERRPVPPRILREVLAHQHEVMIVDARDDPEVNPDLMPVHTTEQLRSTVLIPVHVKARLRGAILFSQRHLHTFTESELALMHHLANAVGTAIAAEDARLQAADAS